MQRSAAERKARMLPEEVFQELSDLYKMFADRTRIRILYVLQNKEMCVSDIAQQLDMTQSAISHQLSTLKQGKLVKVGTMEEVKGDDSLEEVFLELEEE